eukprot:CAMPEP_0201565550 /NCGR_PEP_ID=MMETSP0190_2-20130828/4727_1 /ASSEMBLY_ACC=CAM_ASM_000263 /TAXON_ID=37353 /ORGANISM="Rosalina sp." /LENGTH=58 /DNA_ID=CAMNT_0047983173 /DNA_START=90 /DNA_END=266 /DNA_ORIENTATION=+
MGCSTSTLDDDPHPSGPNTENQNENKGQENDKSKDNEPVITYENNESQGNKFISNEQL